MKPDDKHLTAGLSWQLRVSRRTRYARLQIKPFGGLEVVIPPRFPRHEVPGLVAKHAAWARRQISRQTELRNAICLPRQLSLAFDDSTTRVIYNTDRQPEDFISSETDHILVLAEGYRERIGELRQWVRHKAWMLLPSRLEQLSAETGLQYNKSSIRSQKSRWGSCSIHGNISLNDQLLFLPASAVEYLMIHELCHTRHLNHSKKFWSLVERHCADYREQEKVLNDSRSRVPDWFLLDLYS